jgi:ATP-dependent Clp protease ATP-binding subunit ClpC
VLFDRLSMASRKAIFCARAEASLVGSKVIDTQHVLVGLIRVDPGILQLIAQRITVNSVREAVNRWQAPGDKVPTSVDIPLSQDSKQVFLNALAFAEVHKSSFIRTEHLLLALMTLNPSHAAEILREADASLDRLEQLVSGLANEEQDADPSWNEGLEGFFGHAEAHIRPIT